MNAQDNCATNQSTANTDIITTTLFPPCCFRDPHPEEERWRLRNVLGMCFPDFAR